MEAFSVPILLGLIASFVIYGLIVALRRKDSFWEDKPKIRGKARRNSPGG